MRAHYVIRTAPVSVSWERRLASKRGAIREAGTISRAYGSTLNRVWVTRTPDEVIVYELRYDVETGRWYRTEAG